jgi:serine-type D-Ala-D-Ala carboxypeptidase (penicillin-binding protein 5/6)
VNARIKAPVEKGQVLGKINVTLNGENIAQAPLVALQADPKGSLWRRFNDMIALAIHHFFGRT